jgi:hypothetical protein
MNRLEIYDKVNQCETLEQLAEIILQLADSNGQIQGRTKKFDAARMAERCLFFNKSNPNNLSREFGIRQQAMYILYYSELNNFMIKLYEIKPISEPVTN